jgi:hypothetical protein
VNIEVREIEVRSMSRFEANQLPVGDYTVEVHVLDSLSNPEASEYPPTNDSGCN